MERFFSPSLTAKLRHLEELKKAEELFDELMTMRRTRRRRRSRTGTSFDEKEREKENMRKREILRKILRLVVEDRWEQSSILTRTTHAISAKHHC